MKLKISLGKLNGCGSCATIEDDDDHQLDIINSMSDGAGMKTCLRAAKMLREAADKFEALAKCDDIYKCTTHDRINNRPVNNPKA